MYRVAVLWVVHVVDMYVPSGRSDRDSSDVRGVNGYGSPDVSGSACIHEDYGTGRSVIIFVVCRVDYFPVRRGSCILKEVDVRFLDCNDIEARYVVEEGGLCCVGLVDVQLAYSEEVGVVSHWVSPSARHRSASASSSSTALLREAREAVREWGRRVV